MIDHDGLRKMVYRALNRLLLEATKAAGGLRSWQGGQCLSFGMRAVPTEGVSRDRSE